MLLEYTLLRVESVVHIMPLCLAGSPRMTKQQARSKEAAVSHLCKILMVAARTTRRRRAGPQILCCCVVAALIGARTIGAGEGGLDRTKVARLEPVCEPHRDLTDILQVNGQLFRVDTLERRRDCGPRALAALLALEHCPTGYAEVADAVAIGPDGATVAALTDASAKFGVPLKAVRAFDATKVPTPAIALLFGRKSEEDSTSAIYHFVVVQGVDSVEVRGYDPTISGKFRLAHPVWATASTGIYLVKHTGGIAQSVQECWPWVTGGVIGSMLYTLMRLLLPRLERFHKSGTRPFA
jgi:Peptidase C39 family